MLRGTKSGLEFVFAGGGFDEAWPEDVRRIAERPDFYRGSRGTAIFGAAAPPAEPFARFAAALRNAGVELHGLYGDAGAERLALDCGLDYLGAPPLAPVAPFETKRAAKRADDGVPLTPGARSLEADFAGARAEIARRRARGEASVRRPDFTPAPVAALAVPAAPAAPGTLYHRGTLRGGQSLQQLGNIVVVGDVNPGAELTASGDILVFGALRGTAHAGAQGDAAARVFALELAPTQLRIAALIAADESARRKGEAEVAFIDGERIAIAPAGAGVRA